MILDAINLVNQKGHFFLIDNYYCKPVVLSRKAYEVLAAYKSGVEICRLKKDFGAELVDTILNGLTSLQEKNIISKNKRDFQQIAKSTVKQLSNIAARNLPMTEGVFMVAQNCNLACKYCYGGESGSFNSKGLMSKQMAEDFLRYHLSLGENLPFQKVLFLGGEPLLNMEVITHVIELWDKWKHEYNGKELYFALTTNGTLLTHEIIEYFKKKQVSITVSLDGPRDMHNANRVFVNGQGSYDRVIDGINLLRKYNVPFHVRSTITGQTRLDELFDFFNEQNFNMAYVVPVFPELHPEFDYQLNIDEFREYSKKYQDIICEGCRNIIDGDKDSFKAKQLSLTYRHTTTSNKITCYPFKCAAGYGLIAYGIDGNIYPCQRFVGNKLYSIGHVQNGIDFNKLVSFFTRYLDASESCNSCWAVSFCGRRCFNQKSTGDGGFEQLPEQICDVYREIYASSIVYSTEIKEHMKNDRSKMDEAFKKFETQHMMEEYVAARNSGHE